MLSAVRSVFPRLAQRASPQSEGWQVAAAVQQALLSTSPNRESAREERERRLLERKPSQTEWNASAMPKHPTKPVVARFQQPPSCEPLGAEQPEHATGSSQTRQNWLNFIKGFPATLTGDVVYRAGLFKVADANSDGHVSREELRDFLCHMPNTTLTEDQLDRLIEAADINKDGKLQLDEFVNLFKYGLDKGIGISH
mmetsp:Transcript_3615/g.8202  ORF Transcript_3615/g.8202 Transcript_3615/m.8202 type:complete len:197 (-) Transcript_3615:100-690(-)